MVMLFAGCERSALVIRNDDRTAATLDVAMSDDSDAWHVTVPPGEQIELLVNARTDAHANVRGEGIASKSVGYWTGGNASTACVAVRGGALEPCAASRR